MKPAILFSLLVGISALPGVAVAQNLAPTLTEGVKLCRVAVEWGRERLKTSAEQSGFTFFTPAEGQMAWSREAADWRVIVFPTVNGPCSVVIYAGGQLDRAMQSLRAWANENHISLSATSKGDLYGEDDGYSYSVRALPDGRQAMVLVWFLPGEV